MSQNEPKINPATGYVHDDSQLEEVPFTEPVGFDESADADIEKAFEPQPEENKEATE